MNKKTKLIVAGIMLISIFGLSVEVLSRHRLKYVEVYSVKEIMKPRSKISEEDLKSYKIPRIFIEEDTVKDKEELIDHYVKLNHHLYPNKMITKQEIESLELSNDEALLGLNEQEKLFPMKAGPLESLGNMLRSGHKVDVYLRYSKSYKESTTTKLASSIRVLGLKDRNGEDINTSNTSPHTILLAIDEEMVEMFVRAQGEGEIILTGTNSQNDTPEYFEDWQRVDDEL